MLSTYYSVFVIIHTTIIGAATTSHTTADWPFFVVASHVSGFLGVFYVNLLLLQAISPFLQLLHSSLHFNLFLKGNGKLQFHFTMAINASIFISFHILYHIFHAEFSSSSFVVFSITSPAIITGIGISVAFLVALFSGSFPSLLQLHVASVICMCALIMFHGLREVLSPSYGDTATMIVILISLFLIVTFRISCHTMNLYVVREDCCTYENREGKFMLLVLRNNLFLRAAGNYIIYNSTSPWLLFHSHSFMAFSTTPNKLCFYFKINPNQSSFTHKLCEGVMANTITRYYPLKATHLIR